MEGSSEFGLPRSDSSRGLDISGVSYRNTNRISLSGDESGLMPRGKASDGGGIVLGHTDHTRSLVDVGFPGVYADESVADPFVRAIEWGVVSLRQWLDKPERSVDAFECLHIFRQIVDIVNVAHSQGIAVHNVRPSCFVMSSFNRVSFIESASCSDSGSDSLEDESNPQTVEVKGSTPTRIGGLHPGMIMFGNEDTGTEPMLTNASLIVSETTCLHLNPGVQIPADEERFSDSRDVEQAEEQKESFPMKQVLLMEGNWYTSPEEVAGVPSSCSSDIYRLGVLLFELFCTFSSREEKSRTMCSLRHRVLPPQFLLKWPKEALFCLWLLHPEPSSRPTMCDLLRSDFFNEPRENLGEREAAMELREKIEQQELLLEFLLMLQQRKQEAADKLRNTISYLSLDIEEVSRRQKIIMKEGSSFLEPRDNNHSATDASCINIDQNEDSTLGSRKRFRSRVPTNVKEVNCAMDKGKKSETQTESQESVLSKNSRLMKNFKKLELAYLMTRCKPIKASAKPGARHSSIPSSGTGSLVLTERSSVNNVLSNEEATEGRQSGWIHPFLEDLCKYFSFSKLKVKADLKQGDLLNSSNLVCSLSFDRDGEFFASAGVNKKIKIFDCDSILNEDQDIHYPVVEMASRSRLSSTCWNNYIKSQIACSNFEGLLQIWDVTRGQVLTEMREHERRVWSIDFSSADPTLLASGSDDGSVKLWNINQGPSVSTIRTKANVCCVQFPSDSGRYLAFGSADHRIYYYDLRNSKVPLCTLIGHNKTVSYVKFVDSKNLISASTDNTLKLWNLSMCTSRVLDSPIRSFTGHMNVKNFVGLSLSDGYIAAGSETNEVFIYHKALPMPTMSFKFNSIDPFSGLETDDAAKFISSVCWRGQSSTLVAANSTGNIKILEMV